MIHIPVENLAISQHRDFQSFYVLSYSIDKAARPEKISEHLEIFVENKISAGDVGRR